MGRGKTEDMNEYASRQNAAVDRHNNKLSNASVGNPATSSDRKVKSEARSKLQQDTAQNFRHYESKQ